uniref:DUF834 domain-containing protein n=1 Tax=Oryza sativa subsp. japonica TaxID=39947 RepID=Q6ZHL6_ORYSJ|nr:hypothetical protein [Oryza sativa Japonica Group]
MAFWWWFCGFGVEAGVELDVAKPSVETVQHGGDGNGGGGRLNDAGERRRLVARWGGFPVAIGENGAAAGVRQRAANAMAQAARRGDSGSGGSGRLEGRWWRGTDFTRFGREGTSGRAGIGGDVGGNRRHGGFGRLLAGMEEGGYLDFKGERAEGGR